VRLRRGGDRGGGAENQGSWARATDEGKGKL